MIRFHSFISDDYFIDKETAVITRKDGSIVETRLHHSYYVVKNEPGLTGIPIHVIQANTWYGYQDGKVIHHIDRNKLNNSLSNLKYLTPEEHSYLHRTEDENRGFGCQLR